MKMKVNFKNKEKLTEFSECILRKGLKYSRKREIVVDYFVRAKRHFTVEQLYDEIKKVHPGISYTTIYRALKLLVECGVASMHHFGEDETRFELRDREDHHDHLICIKCGRIIEFTHHGIEKFQKEVARKCGFIPQNHILQIYGLCSTCQKKGKAK
jgi:Fur family ferric uptake transcriptional regulator